MQLIELELLVEFDRVCRLHNISYVITDGTMLGAIRHKGFIPWDDDADVCMLREDYERFKKEAMKDLLYIPFEFENGGTRVIHYTPETYIPKGEIE